MKDATNPMIQGSNRSRPSARMAMRSQSRSAYNNNEIEMDVLCEYNSFNINRGTGKITNIGYN